MAMQYSQFGNTPLRVSEIGFGCARLGGFLQNTTKGEIADLLRAALDQGVTFYDTADMYCQGESEKLLGEAFRRRRDKVVIASKGGYCLPTQRRLAATIKPFLKSVAKSLGIERKHLPSGLTGTLSQNFTPSYLLQAVEGSLKRLGTDHLDLYQLHSPPVDVLRSADYIAVLEKLKDQGKIRYYGVSCEAAEDALLCLPHAGISSLQLGMGMLDQEAIDHALPQARAQGVAIIARGCFGGGFLKPDADLQDTEPKRQLIEECQQLADQHDRPLMEMALQFVLGIEGVTVTILGMRTAEHLAANLRYAAAPSITPTEWTAIRALAAPTQPEAR